MMKATPSGSWVVSAAICAGVPALLAGIFGLVFYGHLLAPFVETVAGGVAVGYRAISPVLTAFGLLVVFAATALALRAIGLYYNRGPITSTICGVVSGACMAYAIWWVVQRQAGDILVAYLPFQVPVLLFSGFGLVMFALVCQCILEEKGKPRAKSPVFSVFMVSFFLMGVLAVGVKHTHYDPVMAQAVANIEVSGPGRVAAEEAIRARVVALPESDAKANIVMMLDEDADMRWRRAEVRDSVFFIADRTPGGFLSCHGGGKALTFSGGAEEARLLERAVLHRLCVMRGFADQARI